MLRNMYMLYRSILLHRRRQMAGTWPVLIVHSFRDAVLISVVGESDLLWGIGDEPGSNNR